MKVFAIILLCAFAAVQGRSAGVSNTKALAVLGEQPNFVHLRIAVSTSGLLESCAGSLIDSWWVLTAASCVRDARFIWVRYGVVNVIEPSLVTENSIVHLHPAANVALIQINRSVETTVNIAPVVISGVVPDSATFCGFGSNEAGGPGEQLSCYDVALTAGDNGEYTADSEDGAPTQYDIGAPLVSDGVQVAIFVGASQEDAPTFLSTAGFCEWIKEETGLSQCPEADKDSEDSNDSEDSLKVNFVN